MQAASDIFLGWCPGAGDRHFYVRQLDDAKIKPLVECCGARRMSEYALACGTVLANAHASSGPAAAIAAYLGKGAHFDACLARFANACADQNEVDHERFKRAVAAGRIDVADAAG